MAERVFRHNVGTQNHEGAAFYRGFKEITQIVYPEAGESMVGEQLFGADDLGTDGLHHEKFFHTRLQGQAAVLPDKVRQRFPMASYRTGSILVQGYRQIGIAYEYYPEDLEDNLAGFNFLADLASDLPILLRDTEEDMHLSFYNNGESASQLVGFANTPLFVDGTTHRLQLLGQPDFFNGQAASNIITNGGGVSYAMLSLAKQYGRNFVNEEGRTNPLRIVGALGREQNIELLKEWIDAPSNIEQFDGARRNPAEDLRGISYYVSERLAQPNDLIFFFEGWQDDIKMRAKYQNKADSWTEGNAQYRKVYSQTRSRLGYYAYNNRRVLLMRGAA